MANQSVTIRRFACIQFSWAYRIIFRSSIVFFHYSCLHEIQVDFESAIFWRKILLIFEPKDIMKHFSILFRTLIDQGSQDSVPDPFVIYGGELLFLISLGNCILCRRVKFSTNSLRYKYRKKENLEVFFSYCCKH